MADEELEALRRQRLAELQAKHGDPGDAAQQEAKHREAEMRNSILAQVLDQSARARLSNLALVKPEKTKAVENYLIQMARYGQLSEKVSLDCLEELDLLYQNMASKGQLHLHWITEFLLTFRRNCWRE
ncbi:programmed cell death protein 5 isoform X1 [Macaca thibetana thibetana]|uniref:programmed cell death protein 5 isoform X1 n=1 Tax=Macaca thibetana thibetana TaxID=257877 RepID=UPI0021BC6E89|nr:programmed cell death protein 5 isoform X1 [Macaca thibetana thibetana]XP_050627954.1 programmed cell death protein 5 isoform X1 [Macaca thibetana thibetana]XP_050627955.1 programmed cell death protein 5 isoform X1 [Macaca thibetana thibetana]XP_050627956.1 programmed cell death protein 5 isoform X1 [Macaca thibetana thibetana]XP_050627957.1 programmed cell death protein 5 isoform X1 [Macaca thibetana thibetana]